MNEIMDTVMAKLVQLSKDYMKAKNEFFQYSDTLKDSFNLSEENKSSVAFGIVDTKDPNLQKYVDILNSDETLIDLNSRFSKIKLEAVTEILQYALKCEEEIPGYDLNIILRDPSKNRGEIYDLYEGFAGVHHIHDIEGKIMLEIPAREYVFKNRRLLKYVDFWAKETKEICLRTGLFYSFPERLKPRLYHFSGIFKRYSE
ncbi:MAG: hypothetical protein ACM3NR_03210 [Methanosarcina sp.]